MRANCTVLWVTLLAVACVMACQHPAVAAEPTAKPKDQFQSVVYVRKAGAAAEVYKQLGSDTIAMTYPQDFYKWGGKYMYMWFFPHLISNKGDTTGFDAAVANSPRGYVDTFSRACGTTGRSSVAWASSSGSVQPSSRISCLTKKTLWQDATGRRPPSD